MRGLLKFGFAAAVGAGIAYLFDPDRGRTRRAMLADQAAARARDASETVKAKAEYQKGVAKGVVHEVADSLREERVYDDETLLQKVRSEALGYWPDAGDVEVDISDGMVRVSGSVNSEPDRDRLIGMIREVDGVGLIDDRLRVGT